MRAAVLCLGLALATTARAEPTCAHLTAFVGQLSADPVVLSDPLPSAQQCGATRSAGGADALHCFWMHPYRAAEADAAFERLVRTIRTCFDDARAIADDLRVNHPDSYDLKQFRADGALISVSRKDKATLGKTYVFLRAERRP